MVDRNDTEINIGDMVRFKEDRYTSALGIVLQLTPTGRIWLTVCGGGGMGERLLSPQNVEIVNDLED